MQSVDLHASVAVCIVFLLPFVNGDCRGIFSITPTSVKGVLNSTINFECSGQGIALVWLINEEVLSTRYTSNPPQTTYHSGNATSVLSLQALLQLNDSAVTCQVYNVQFGSCSSPPARIVLQGILSPPHRVRHNATENTITLFWDAPYTLEGVPIDNYTIEVINVDTRRSLQPGVAYETTYNFTASDSENLSRCFRYQFIVSANNEVGKGTSSDPVEANFENEPRVIDTADVTITVMINNPPLDNEDTVVTVEFSIPAEEYCNSASYYRIYAERIDGDTISTAVNLAAVLDAESSRLSIAIDSVLSELEENNKYNAVIEAFSMEGVIGNSTGVNISTFDVQSVNNITENPPGNFCLSCNFATGSLARGCSVEMALNNSGSTAVNNGYKEQTADSVSVCISLNEGGWYNLSVFDIEQDDTTYTAKAAITMNYNIQGLGNSCNICASDDVTKLLYRY